MSEMEVAFELLGVGMVTVMIMLGLVVILGNLIIRFVNKFIGEDEKPEPKQNNTSTPEINAKKIAAIVTAVNIISKGTGKVINVQKL